MIRVAVLYPNKAGAKFDHQYYATSHMPMVKKKLSSFGLIKAEIDTGLGGGAPDSDAPYASIGYLLFDSIENFQKGMGAHGEEIMSDIPNYTDIAPEIQVSELAEI